MPRVESAQQVAILADSATIASVCYHWASDLAWVTLDRGENDLCRFKLTHVSLLAAKCYVWVVCSPHADGCVVEFHASVGRKYPGIEKDADALAESFAHGVCRAPVAQGVRIQPSWLTQDLRKRHSRQSLCAKISEPLAWGLMFAALVAGVVTGLATWNPFAGFAVGMWVLVPRQLACLLRYRTAGMPADFPVFAYLALSSLCAIVTTVAAHYYPGLAVATPRVL